jgi:hypothetical protein
MGGVGEGRVEKKLNEIIDAVNLLLTGLPADLIAVLRDPTVTIQRDHEILLADGRTLFEHLEDWRKAPSNTASAAGGSGR